MSAVAAEMRRRTQRLRADGSLLDVLFVPVLIVVLVVWLTTTTDVFLTSINLSNILVQTSLLAVVAFSLTLVILAGEFDLSVGSVVSLSGVIGAYVMAETGSIPLGFAAGLALGVLVGTLNGVIVTVVKAPSFIVTLGSLVICAGLAQAISGASLISLPDSAGIVQGELLGVSRLIWIMGVGFLAVFFIQSETRFGVQLRAIGSNREAARLSGLPVDRVRVAAFALSGLGAGIGGMMVTSRVLAGQPNAGTGLELTAVAAVVVGGTSIYGGRGSVGRTLMGILLLAVLGNGLDLKGVGPDLQNAISGGVLILAASADFFRRALSRRRLRARPAEAAIEPPNLKRQPDDHAASTPTEVSS